MKDDHFELLLSVAGATLGDDGWQVLPADRLATLYAAANGATLTVSRVQALRRQGELVLARTAKGEQFVLALIDVHAGAVEAPPTSTRAAGFQPR